jgi:hypothetical protein
MLDKLKRADQLRSKLDERRASLDLANRRLSARVDKLEACLSRCEKQHAEAQAAAARAEAGRVSAEASAEAASAGCTEALRRLGDAEELARDAAAAATRSWEEAEAQKRDTIEARGDAVRESKACAELRARVAELLEV